MPSLSYYFRGQQRGILASCLGIPLVVYPLSRAVLLMVLSIFFVDYLLLSLDDSFLDALPDVVRASRHFLCSALWFVLLVDLNLLWASCFAYGHLSNYVISVFRVTTSSNA